jgi:hypothetical protein
MARYAADTNVSVERSKVEIERILSTIKAMLAAVDAGIMAFEDVFLAWTALPDGLTVGESVRPAIAAAYETGQVAPLLALGPGSDR